MDASVSDTAAVVVAAVAAFGLALLLWACVALVGAVRSLRAAVTELRDEAVPAVAALRRTIAEAGGELDRIDSLVGAAETVSSTVDSATRLAHAAFSTPVIKGLAAANGAGKAVRRLKTGANGKPG